MGSSDQIAAEGHLEHAVRHLETARQLFASAAGSPELSCRQRGALRASAVDADVELDRLTRLAAGETLEGELARLVAELDDQAELDERELPDER
jgi:hypothetical protein